jgi:hypothetical protein
MAEFSEQMKKERSGQVEIINGSKESDSPPPPPSSSGNTNITASSSASASSSSVSSAGAPPKTYAHNPKLAKRSK